MPLHQDMHEVLDFIASRNVPPHYELSPEEARSSIEKGRYVFGGEPIPLPRVEESSLPGEGGEIPIRLYSPFAKGHSQLLPMLVYFHGGGWVMGSLDSHDAACRYLAQVGRCLLISVDYRLAPEHKFPAAVQDSLSAVKELHARATALGGDPEQLAVGGDSAGGNLAAVLAQQSLQGVCPPLVFQLLIYPVVTCDYNTPSMRNHGEGQFLTVKGMRWFWGHYLNSPQDVEDLRVSPLKAPSLAGLPPAHVVTVEYDPLCDEGQEYARRLQAAQVPTTTRHYPGLMHGVFNMTKTQSAVDLITETGAVLHKALHKTSNKTQH